MSVLIVAGHVGVPNVGEKICASCKGSGWADCKSLNYFDGCDVCAGTGVVRSKKSSPENTDA